MNMPIDFRQPEKTEHRWFISAIIAFIVLDTLSLAAYTIPIVNWIALPLIIGCIISLTARDSRWMIIIPFFELIWNSFGMAFVWDMFGLHISLRMVVFGTVLAQWIFMRLRTAVQPRSKFTLHSSVGRSFLALCAVAAWGIARGIAQDNGTPAILLDGNAYAFILYIPIWYDAFSIRDIHHYMALACATALALSVKTIALFNIFAQQYEFINVTYLYLWVRDLRFGEITHVTSAVWRVFMQSQLYIGIVLAGITARLFIQGAQTRARFMIPMLALLGSAVLLSMSRSFWLGLLIMAVCTGIATLVHRGSQKPIVLHSLGIAVASAAASFLIIFLAYNTPQPSASLSQSFADRIVDSAGDAAGASRIDQLRPLLARIREHLFTGSGFGATVTYRSSDPRIKNWENPSGFRTTYSFEWGYLDQALKIGIVGLFIILGVVASVLVQWYQLIRSSESARRALIPIISGLLFILTVHATSPYLNHPLGLGYLALTLIAVSRYNEIS